MNAQDQTLTRVTSYKLLKGLAKAVIAFARFTIQEEIMAGPSTLCARTNQQKHKTAQGDLGSDLGNFFGISRVAWHCSTNYYIRLVKGRAVVWWHPGWFLDLAEATPVDERTRESCHHQSPQDGDQNCNQNGIPILLLGFRSHGVNLAFEALMGPGCIREIKLASSLVNATVASRFRPGSRYVATP